MTLKFKLVTRLYNLFDRFFGEEHRVTYYFYCVRERMLESHSVDDYELLAMIIYPDKL